ncbi:hypothetical protein [Kitasatospora sp. NPDC093679]|uniref:hypothetical protein n=1 Tax=Kitasatospora sp. NPDC093679 TaxID=3154983 RepID=UPI003447CD32
MTAAVTGEPAGAGRVEEERAAQELAERRVRRALGAVEVVGGRALHGGLYNSARLVELADGRRMVLKAAPPADAPALTHEQGLLGTETLFHRLAAATGAPRPRRPAPRTGRPGHLRRLAAAGVPRRRHLGRAA